MGVAAAAVSLSTLLLGIGFALTSLEQQLRVILSWYAIALGIILVPALRFAPAAAPLARRPWRASSPRLARGGLRAKLHNAPAGNANARGASVASCQ